MLAKATGEWTIEDAAHLMRRAGFGGSPTEVAEVHALGREAAVEALLKPSEPIDAIPLPAWADREKIVEQAKERFMSMREANQTGGEEARRKARQVVQRENRRNGVEGQGWWFGRLMNSKAPLREKMTLFWHDHFATSLQKVKQPGLMLLQNQLFRENAFGDFKALTHAVLHDPAMAIYLDIQTSTKKQPNENFAREVMELFTLGEGHYSEEDIQQAARAFTGYKVDRRKGEVTHAKRQWDGGEKTILGKKGRFDGDGVIDVLFEHQAAAEYVPSKLWQYFVEDEAPPAIVKRLATTFRKNNHRVEPLLREIFLSRAFFDSSVRRGQIKSPVQYLVQMCRELELDGLPSGYALAGQQQLGQVLFLPPNVAGWDWGKGWINTNTLLTRYNIAGMITKGAVSSDGNMIDEMAKGAKGPMARFLKRGSRNWAGPDYEKITPRELRKDPEALVDDLVTRIFQADPGVKQRRTFVDYAKAKKGAVFTNHEVAELCHLMMSTPHYQLV
ncbi:MAG: DUF1800 domain-containing protein [Verrucomicrobiota bacterium]